MPTSYLRRKPRQDTKPRAKSLADLPSVLPAAARVQPEVLAIASILDTPATARQKTPVGAAFMGGLRLAPSRSMQDTLASGAIRLGLLLDRMRAASPNPCVKAACERVQHICMASLRASERLVSDVDVSRVDRADAVAILTGAYLACESLCVSLSEHGVMPVGLVDPVGDALALIRKTLASTCSRTERAGVAA
jgi:hypothetical protein